jgi:hypothetical protein
VTSSIKSNVSHPIVLSGRRCGGLWRVAVGRGVVAVVVAGLLLVGIASPAVADDTCANAVVRAQTGSTGLPDCRAYETVSPSYKQGFAVDPSNFIGFTDDGIVSYQSFGSFAGNPQGTVVHSYHAARSSHGWMTTALGPPDWLYDTEGDIAEAESDDLRQSMWRIVSRRSVPSDKSGFYLRDSDGAFTRVLDADDALGPRLALWVADDFARVVFNHGSQGPTLTALYEHVGIGNDDPPRAVSVDNHGDQTPANSCLNDVSADGRVIVYTAGCDGGITQVWARVGGSASVAVSGSECTRSPGDPDGACNGAFPASYAGEAVDGSRVFFTTRQQLVNGDTDTGNGVDPSAGNDLYACDVPAGVPAPVGAANPCASLTQVSSAATDAHVESVAAISQDGSRVYFVARGVLADNLGVGDVGPATGANAHNLYLWERDGAQAAGVTTFVARLADKDGQPDLEAARLTPDNRYLLFLTGSKLVDSGPGSDEDGGTVDAYRYDSVTKVMVRVSTSVSGGGGNGPGFDVSLARSTSMSDDGGTVIFDTDEALSSADVNGASDVYSWHDGQVALISAGGGDAMGISSSGRDIFFLTSAQVLASDGDFNSDIYDARVGGGFALAQTPSPCSGDGCQALRNLPPSLAAPSAAVGVGGMSEAPSTFSVRPVSAAQRRALVASGKVRLTVTTNASGLVLVKATATIGGRSVTVGSARRAVTAPGKVGVSLSLSKQARRELAARGRLTVRVAVSHSKVALDRLVTFKLVRSKAKAKRLTRRARVSVVGVSGGRS